jgi:hypothetical protein
VSAGQPVANATARRGRPVVPWKRRRRVRRMPLVSWCFRTRARRRTGHGDDSAGRYGW